MFNKRERDREIKNKGKKLGILKFAILDRKQSESERV